MIKLQDFAKQQGVTDRAIQKHLKTYAAELEGKFERKGPNGTWLTNEACEILRSKMKQAPVIVADEDPRVAKLDAENQALRRKLDDNHDAFQKYVTETAALLTKATEQILLAEKSEANQQRADALEAQNAVLSAEKDAAIQKAAQAEKTAQAATDELTEARKEIERMKSATFWQRLRGFKE